MTSTVSPSINMQTRGPAEPPADAQGGAAGQSRENNHGLTLDVEEIASRRLYSAGAGLDYTPRGPEAAAYKYYCPLCMNYFKGIFESRCCRHYICYECLLAYVAGKYGVTPEDLPFLEVPFLFPLPCPHCSSLAFEPGPVSRLATVRSYEDEADLSASLTAASMGSPVRPGDSFEALQRKMLRFSSQESAVSEPPTPATVHTATEDEHSNPSSPIVAANRKMEAKIVRERQAMVLGARAPEGKGSEEQQTEAGGAGSGQSVAVAEQAAEEEVREGDLAIATSPSAAML